MFRNLTQVVTRESSKLSSPPPHTHTDTGSTFSFFNPLSLSVSYGQTDTDSNRVMTYDSRLKVIGNPI